ncbi:MAG: tRNA pseudouridine(13) synthase TruD, partial [Gammaproteobacteria bacterium]
NATIKTRCEDFVVTEKLGFEATGDGEHLLLYIRKQNLTTTDVAQRLSEITGARRAEIGYCGMKDKYGDCRQWFSLPAAKTNSAQLQALDQGDLVIEQQARNQRKLRIGSHRSNGFRIRLRHLSGARADIDRRLQLCARQGVPNSFGTQRFGREQQNLQQLAALLETADVSTWPRGRRSMTYSAARALLFNQVLAARLRDGCWDQYLPGDVLNLDGTDRYFLTQCWDQTLQDRLQRLDIHPSGPLCGVADPKDRYVTSGQSADIEYAVLRCFTGVTTWLQHQGLQAARRPLRFLPRDLAWRWEGDSELVLEFELHRGCYATSLLREVCRVIDASPGLTVKKESSSESQL